MPRDSSDPLLIDHPTSALRPLLSLPQRPSPRSTSQQSLMFSPSASSSSVTFSLQPSPGSERSSSPSSSSSASSSPPFYQQQPQLCAAWEQGRCTRGEHCRMIHLGTAAGASHSASSSPYAALSSYPSFPSASSSSAASAFPFPSSSAYPSSSPLYSSLFASAASAMQQAGGASAAYSELDDFHLDPKFPSHLSRNGQSLASLSPFPSTSPNGSLYSLSYPGSALPPTHRKECWDWLAGRCTRGSLCKYTHAMQGHTLHAGLQQPSPRNDNVCHQWTRTGQCQYGDVCKFAHISHLQPGNGTTGLPLSRPSADGYDGDDYQQGGQMGRSPLLFFKEQQQTASSPPVLFRDARLGLDTEVCRFYAKHSRCKYSNACKFVHIHHGGGGMQVSGVNVTIGELHRLCALHGPGGLAGLPLQSNSQSLGAMPGMRKSAGQLGGMGFDKEYGAMEREAREREMKELRDLQRVGIGPGGMGGSSLSPVSASYRELSISQSTRSTPTLGGGLNGTLSPSLLHLSGLRQGTEGGKVVGGSVNGASGYPSPLSFGNSSPSSSTVSSMSALFQSSSFRVSSAESRSPPSGGSSAQFSHPRPVARPSMGFIPRTSAELSELTGGEYVDDDSVLISGSTYAALNGSGALASGMGGGYAGYGEEASQASQQSGGMAAGQQGSGATSASSSPEACSSCGVNSVFHDYLCSECYTSLLR